MYESAITVAKANNDSSKVRRYERGLKTLQGMSRSLKAGKRVNMEDLPPEVSVTGKPAPQPAEDDMDELQSWIAAEQPIEEEKKGMYLKIIIVCVYLLWQIS